MKIHTFALATALLATTGATAAFAQDFSDKDKTFLKDSTEDNLAEIKMAEMTVRTTKNPAIKAFAEQMIKEHNALIAGSKPVAMKAGVTPPTTTSAKAEAEYLKLKVLTGNEYDKSYVKNHGGRSPRGSGQGQAGECRHNESRHEEADGARRQRDRRTHTEDRDDRLEHGRQVSRVNNATTAGADAIGHPPFYYV